MFRTNRSSFDAACRTLGRGGLWSLLTLGLGLALAPFAYAAPHDDREPLTVAVYEMAPYGGVNPDGTFSGASVDLWRRVAEAVGLDYTLVAAPQMDALFEGVRTCRYDVAIGAITITTERAAHLDFSYPAHRSGVAVALVKDTRVWSALAAYLLAALELSSLILVMAALPTDRALIKITASAEWRAVEETYFAH